LVGLGHCLHNSIQALTKVDKIHQNSPEDEIRHIIPALSDFPRISKGYLVRNHISNLALERFSSFGDLLKFLRRRCGLTQRELSIAVGYSHAQISRLELNQRQPDLATITARFIPVLDLDEEPEIAERLLELSLEMPGHAEPTPGLPPYKGLQYFDEADAGLFFGREQLVSRLTDRLREQLSGLNPLRFLAIIGASGSGKSSVLRAGLLPALRRNSAFAKWQIHSLTPTERPLEALASNLTKNTGSIISTATLMDDLVRDQRALHLTASRITSRKKKISPRSQTPEGLLLIIDQFEELFTLCRSETERSPFIDNLMTAATEQGGRTFVILALRADLYSHCAPYDALREALAEQQEYIGAMGSDELRRTIEEPAKQDDWVLEPGLVDLLLQDIGADGEKSSEPGALPLMSHALLETWHRRQGRKLTISGYLASGGVRGAIADTADDVFQNEFDDSQQVIARNIFLRLTQFGEDEDTADTRRRASFKELIHSPEEEQLVREVITKLADARLITTDNEVVEVAHEALIREWPTLREWLDEDREGLRLQRHLTLAANGWERHKSDSGELYRGTRLAQASAWAETHSDMLSSLEADFLNASRQLAREEEAEREARRQRELVAAQTLAETQKQAAAQLRKRAFYLSGAFILALVMFGVALFQGNRARQIAVTAQSDQRIATSRELASASLNNLDVDPERSILLALQSISTTRNVDGTVLSESMNALHRSIVTSQLRMTLVGHDTWVLSAAYSPDCITVPGAQAERCENQLASVGYDGTLIIWNARTGELLHHMAGSSEPNDFVSTQRVAYSPDGKLLAACEGNLVKIYDPLSGELLNILSWHKADVTAIAISADGRLLASGGLDGSVMIWELSTGSPLQPLAGHTEAIEELSYSPDGNWLVTAGDDPALKIWDVQTGDLLQEYTDFTGVVVGVTFSPDGKQIAFSDGNLHVWQFTQETEENEKTIGYQEIFTIPGAAPGSFSPDGKIIAGLGGTDTSGSVIKLWDAATRRELLTLSGDPGVIGLAFNPDGKSLASTSFDGTVKIWDITPGKEKVVISAPAGGFGTRIAYKPDGGEIATTGGDGTATLWNIETGEPSLTLTGHDLEVMNVAVSTDGTHLATASLDGTAIIWDAASGQKFLTLSGHEDGVRAVAFSPDGALIATGGFDGTAKVWDGKTGELMYEIAEHQGLVLGVAFSPDGDRLATASTDATAKIWDMKTGELVYTLEGHQDGIREAAFSPDGTIIATGSGDGTAILWDAASGSKIMTLIGHSSGIFTVAFSPDSNYLATGSADATAKIWDVATGQEILSLPGTKGGVSGVAFSPNDGGAHLAVSSFDGVVRIFLLKIDELLALAQSRSTRALTTEECNRYLHLEQCPLIRE
jgi:WD40 repeat protein/transcriptional regulator with XRE-family HTH domain